MKNVDKLLLEILQNSVPPIEETLPKQDSKILKSLGMSVSGPQFITENQSRLLLKILKENQKKLKSFEAEISEVLELPTWSMPFRKIEQVKKLYVGSFQDEEQVLIVETTFNSQIRKILENLEKKVENPIRTQNGKFYYFEYTEKNIVAVIDALKPYDFDIDETIEGFYKTIKSWSETEIRDQFLLTNITHQNFQKTISADLGVETPIDKNIINDRSVRYQYFSPEVKNHGETLTEYIANRSRTKIWVDKNMYSLSDIVKSLVELKRLPALVVFEGTNEERANELLNTLKDALEENGIFDKIGIYFRLQNNEQGKKFNQLIADSSYNYKLDNTTQIIGVQSGKIPKFFLTSNWKPMSVISLDTKMGMRHGKTAVFTNCCDLIVEYADAPALVEKKIL